MNNIKTLQKAYLKPLITVVVFCILFSPTQLMSGTKIYYELENSPAPLSLNELDIKILQTEDIYLDLTTDSQEECNSKCPVNGCYNTRSNTIILDLANKNIMKTFYHELGHALFLNDKILENWIKGFPPLKKYCTGNEIILKFFPNLFTDCIRGYNTEKKRIQERVANYYTEYKTDKFFSLEFPSLFIYFRDKEQEIIKQHGKLQK